MLIPRILILYVPCGAGHQKAAEALYDYFLKKNLNVELKDLLEFAPRWYGRIYRDGYYLLIRKYPGLWSWIYQSFEKMSEDGMINRLVRRLENRCFKSFYKYLEETKITTVVAAHFLPISLLKNTPKKIEINVVVTDYYAHSLWVGSAVDKYFVASAGVRDQLIKKGVPANNIFITGIPVRDAEEISLSKEDARRKIGINEKKFTILLLSGACGVGDIAVMVKRMEKFASQLQLLVNTGLNETLQKELESNLGANPVLIKVIGFTNNIYLYYAAANLVITKPGGLTVTECLAFGKPLLLFKAIPGQEEENAKFVVNNQAGLQLEETGEIFQTLSGLINNPELLEKMRNNALRIAQQNSAGRICETIFPSLTGTVRGVE